MNKNEMITAVAEKIEGATKKDIAVVVDVALDTIKETVANGDKVAIAGFGSFEPVVRPERTGRNPKTGEPMLIKSSTAIKFKAGKAFKDAANA